MGFFGGDNSSGADELLEQQLNENRTELEAKKRSLYQARLDIIKGQGAQVWTPNYNSPLPPKKDTGGKPFLPIPKN